jgi:hypothetical protein
MDSASARVGTAVPAGSRWLRITVVAQAAFVVSVLAAALWQGPRYSVLAHSISDMYAVTAPGGLVLVDILTACGIVTIGFALRCVRPALRPGGRRATAGSVLLALSIVGLGDLLSPGERLACRMADPGCTAAREVSNAGGKLDGDVSTVGVFLLVIAGFLLASAMRRTPGWQAWAWPARCWAVLILVFAAADVLSGSAGLGGLFERLLAFTGAAGVAALAGGIRRRA